MQSSSIGGILWAKLFTIIIFSVGSIPKGGAIMLDELTAVVISFGSALFLSWVGWILLAIAVYMSAWVAIVGGGVVVTLWRKEQVGAYGIWAKPKMKVLVLIPIVGLFTVGLVVITSYWPVTRPTVAIIAITCIFFYFAITYRTKITRVTKKLALPIAALFFIVIIAFVVLELPWAKIPISVVAGAQVLVYVRAKHWEKMFVIFKKWKTFTILTCIIVVMYGLWVSVLVRWSVFVSIMSALTIVGCVVLWRYVADQDSEYPKTRATTVVALALLVLQAVIGWWIQSNIKYAYWPVWYQKVMGIILVGLILVIIVPWIVHFWRDIIPPQSHTYKYKGRRDS